MAEKPRIIERLRRPDSPLLAAMALVVGAVLYSSWVLEPMVDAGRPEAVEYLSELAARDQPHSWIFRSADLATAAVVALGAVLGYRGAGSRRERPGWIALGLFAVATGLDAASAMTCAPHLEIGCAQRVPDQVHEVASVVAGTAAFVSVLVFAGFAAASAAHRWFDWAVVIGYSVTGPWVLFEIARDSAGHSAVVGVAQRAQLTVMAAGLLAAAAQAGTRRIAPRQGIPTKHPTM